MNLPTDYYSRYVQESLPKKESGHGKWFIRPHHIETLTTHVKSVKDNVLNTQYYSHYENSEDKNKKIPETQQAIEGIEKTMEQMN